jgi:hypothetical protein
MYMTVTQRVAELQEYARLDGERCNEGSISDCLAFPSEITGMSGPFLLMEEGGNMRAIWRSDSYTFGIDFYGEERARLVVFFLNSSRKKKSETRYFDLAGLPSSLTPESFLDFTKEHVYEQTDEEFSTAPDVRFAVI